ncbi:MAG: hypothetical protein DRR06_16605 [Gammaproteobacteria bacterium]|nr:MAG: hypothetical protein DRR06_16605 [Gammaproteobacteria bacterium]
MAKKADSDFNNVFNDHFNLLNTPVDSQNSKEVVNWGSRGSILDDMSDEERTARNMSGAIDK